MFQFVAVGDIHINLRKDVPLDWQIGRYTKFFKQLIAECKNRGAVLFIAGDTLNSTEPSAEELELFFNLLHDLLEEGITTFIVSGNHETIGAGKSILDHLAVHRFPNITYRPDDSLIFEGVTLHLINHDSLKDDRFPLESSLCNMLVSHFRCNINHFIREEIDVAKFTAGYDLTIAGDIHAPIEFNNIWYTNSPVNDKFEESPNCGFIYGEIDTATEKYKITRIKSEAPKLLQVCCKADELVGLVFNPTDFYRVEVTGTPAELRELRRPAKNVKLDKVPIVDAVLSVEEDGVTLKEIEIITGTVEEELTHYLKTVGYQDQKIADMMAVYKEFA